jgi:5-methylcytosine-specific restriction endonuclease McrA
MFDKYGKNLNFNISEKKTLDTKLGKLSTRKWNINENFKDPFSQKINKISRSNLLKNCLLCKSKIDIEMHHVKHIRKRGKKYIGFHEQMSLINRKQIPVCRECHNMIHTGQYDGISLKEKHR